jgi:hypothetical protein
MGFTMEIDGDVAPSSPELLAGDDIPNDRELLAGNVAQNIGNINVVDVARNAPGNESLEPDPQVRIATAQIAPTTYHLTVDI